MNKEPFLSKQTIVKQLYPVFAVVAALALVIVLPLDDTMKLGLAMLIFVFGGLVSVIAFIKVMDSFSNLRYLQENGYYEQMCLESPEHFSDIYAFTNTFIFSRDRKICLPIERIRSVRPYMVNYINNAGKSKVQLTVYLDDGDEYCFILKTGAVTQEKKAMLVKCIEMLIMRNPHITIET